MSSLTTVNFNSILLAINGLGILGNGGILYFGQNRQLKKVEVTQGLQEVASSLVDMQQVQLTRQEEKLTRQDNVIDDLKQQLSEVREFLLRDSAWHRDATAEIVRLGGTILDPPVLPPRKD